MVNEALSRKITKILSLKNWQNSPPFGKTGPIQPTIKKIHILLQTILAKSRIYEPIKNLSLYVLYSLCSSALHLIIVTPSTDKVKQKFKKML